MPGLNSSFVRQVRSEIQAMELEHEDELEKLADGVDVKKREENREEEVQFKTKLGKNIYRCGGVSEWRRFGMGRLAGVN